MLRTQQQVLFLRKFLLLSGMSAINATVLLPYPPRWHRHTLELVALRSRLGRLASLGLDVQSDQEHNRDEGAQENRNVGGRGHGHALAREEHRRALVEEGHLGGDGGSAHGALQAGGDGRRLGAQGQGRGGREGLGRGDEREAEEGDASVHCVCLTFKGETRQVR